MPPRAKFLLLFLLVATQVLQHSGAEKQVIKYGRRTVIKIITGKRLHIIRCCGLVKCSDAFGQAKTPSKSGQNTPIVLQDNSTLGPRGTAITTLGELLSTQNDFSAVETSDFFSLPESTNGDMPSSTTKDTGIRSFSAASKMPEFNNNPETLQSSIITDTDTEIPEILATTEIPEFVPFAKPSVDLGTKTSELNNPSESITETRTSTIISNTPTMESTKFDTRTEIISGTTILTSLNTLQSSISPESINTTKLITTLTTNLSKVSTTTATEKPSTNMVTTTTTMVTTIDPALFGECKRETNAAVNPAFFLTNGELKDPDVHGFWLNACGQTFLLGKSLGSWYENSDKCFSLKMQPFALESKEKLDCMKIQAKGWKFNMNYWTGGAKYLASGAFGWCSANGSKPWQDVLPLVNLDKEKNCVQMQINKTSGSISISGRRCSDKTIFACQGPPTKGPKCTSPVCPSFTCERDPLLFTSSAGEASMILKNHTVHGKWFTVKLRNYLFSFEKDTRTNFGAMKACCALGMTLLSLDEKYKYDALASISKTVEMNKELQNLTFWTSGSDGGCESVFGFCSAKRLFRGEAKWLPGQPDNVKGKENHVAVHIWRQRGQVRLADYDGMKRFRYICEQRRNPQSKNGKQAIIDECSIIYNVTSTEIDLLQNATILDLRMKCVGDAVGLLVDGKFVPSEVFAMFESINMQNANELMKNMAIMDECNNKTYGMDECDKAYQLTKCARDKAPAVFDQMIKNLDNLASDSFELSSRSSACVYCNANIMAKKNLTSLNATMNPSSYIEYINRTYLIKCSDSKMYIIMLISKLTYDQSVKKCCEIGMRLLSPLNYAKALKCINSTLPAKTAHLPQAPAITNGLMVDVTSGLSFDCESQTSYFPQNLSLSHTPGYNPNQFSSAGPLATHFYYDSVSSQFKYDPYSLTAADYSMCEFF
ncbi:uncharacterized protein LOC132195783 [Neocloeon triangulifer]|uniref:uncharacterized protein LOC132195783 n=1 Tax=Neocloeon triangulifer TaxID=2078957 RepID=UPI00286F6627|nr:uncharacterized protein LOC132195783 [Neocloeon triangulifer]